MFPNYCQIICVSCCRISCCFCYRCNSLHNRPYLFESQWEVKIYCSDINWSSHF